MLGFRHEIRRAGSILYKKGDLISHLYIIVSGKVRVYEDRQSDLSSTSVPSNGAGKLGSGMVFMDPSRDSNEPKGAPEARWLSQENIRLEVGRRMCVGEGAMLRSGGEYQMTRQFQDSERPLGASSSTDGQPMFTVRQPAEVNGSEASKFEASEGGFQQFEFDDPASFAHPERDEQPCP